MFHLPCLLQELALGKDSSKLNPLAPHGTVLASLTLAQESCLPGGQLEVALALDNRSGAAVKHVEVSGRWQGARH